MWVGRFVVGTGIGYSGFYGFWVFFYIENEGVYKWGLEMFLC